MRLLAGLLVALTLALSPLASAQTFNGFPIELSGAGASVPTSGAGSGDVVGPASATDNAIVRFDGTTGKLVQNSVVTVSDTGVITTAGNIITTSEIRAPYITAFSNALDTGFFLGTLGDVQLHRDAANTLAQRNGVNGQAFRIYGTFTDASNYERFGITVDTSGAYLTTERAGTGVARNLNIGTGAGGQWRINTSGHLLAITDNTYDIGAAGATRPRNGYFGNDIFLGGSLAASGNLSLGSGGSNLQGPSNGVIGLYNASGTDFNRLQFGGTTSSFPALKRSAAILQARLADDSANAAFEAATLDTNGFTIATLPTAGVAGRQAYVTDQVTACPVNGVAPTAGGALVCPVFDNGVAWVGG